MRKLYITLFFIAATISYSHSQDTEWSFGMHGGPLFGITEDFDGQGGYMLSPGAYFTKNQRFEMGILPYFGRYRYEGFNSLRNMVNSLSILAPRTFKYTSAGINYQWRYTFSTKLLQPYAMAMAGLGYTWLSDIKVEEFGGTSRESFMTMNYGLGLGMQYFLSESLRLDFNLSASGTNAFEDANPQMFVRPMLGIIVQL